MSKKCDNLQPALMVFTDLDGTLLDHETYSFSAAQNALAGLAENNFPLVLASSKTSREMKWLAQNLPVRVPALIVENGSGVVWTAEDRPLIAQHDTLIGRLNTLPAALRHSFEGFTDWGPEGVARETGLPPEQAALAARREFSEPGLWRGDETGRNAFLEALADVGITAHQGGRFLTLSLGADKADRLREVANRLAPEAHVMALGDAPNDIAMLEAADTGVIVANPRGTGIAALPGETTGRIWRTALPGPEGWNEAVLDMIDQMTATTRRPWLETRHKTRSL